MVLDGLRLQSWASAYLRAIGGRPLEIETTPAPLPRTYPAVSPSAGTGAMMSIVGKYVRYRRTSRVSSR